MAVLVLQAFAVQCGAAGRAADQETARAHVTRRPREIAHALETEHRVVDVERNHRLPCVLYAVAAAIHEDIAPASLIPSSRI